MEERPKLRTIDIVPIQFDGRPHLLLRDPFQLTDKMLIVSAQTGLLLALLDGTRTLREIQVDLMRLTGEFVMSDQIEGLLRQLDECLFLENERFREALDLAIAEFRKTSFRQSSLAGSAYPSDTSSLRAMLDSFFEPPKGPGRPEGQKYLRPLKAIVAPHIDLSRGGVTYAWAYKDLAEAPPANLFVILGIAHYPMENLFAATTKDFITPLGRAQTDVGFIEALRKRCGFDLLADEFVHKYEHSVELQVVWLQHLLDEVRIVPIVCAGFEHLVELGESPMSLVQVREFVEALRSTLSEWDEPVTVIASVDLSHLGLRFGDRHPITPSILRWLESEDRLFLEKVAGGDEEGMFYLIRSDHNSRRVDAYPALYVMLKALGEVRGEIRHYDQSVEGRNESVVTFGAVVFP
ncbi:MAG: AmmeMemoRadiSam system protein B [Armatimonadetes bacterium]|nr:AmmeMemoRadiSam system protein B [Armatimonadota bacterium]